MPYVHLANGDVEKLTQEKWDASVEESGTPYAYRKGGKEYAVIGVYPVEYEHPKSSEVLAEEQKKEEEERAAFDEWRATQHSFEGNPL